MKTKNEIESQSNDSNANSSWIWYSIPKLLIEEKGRRGYCSRSGPDPDQKRIVMVLNCLCLWYKAHHFKLCVEIYSIKCHTSDRAVRKGDSDSEARWQHALSRSMEGAEDSWRNHQELLDNLRRGQNHLHLRGHLCSVGRPLLREWYSQSRLHNGRGKH